jgi:malate synthase
MMPTKTQHIPPMSSAPEGFSVERELPPGFGAFYKPLHDAFTPRQQQVIADRKAVLKDSLEGKRPRYLGLSEAGSDWRIALPAWCADQRNQMTGPADDRELVVKMLNSGAPGVMIDLEDSMANVFSHTLRGIDNAVAAYTGELTYADAKNGGKIVSIAPSPVVLWTRVRGLHLSQAGITKQPTSASLFDLALLAYKLDFSRLRHPLAIYIPKTESADEALWWRDVFAAVAVAKGQPANAIKCMALVESYPFAFQIEEFAYTLRDHLLGLNLGRWDYMASLIRFNLDDPAWVLPDRNTIPFDVPFFQALRERIPEVCHAHGLLAIGGMTAIFPDRANTAFNTQALEALRQDKKNEAGANATPDLRPPLDGAGTKTVNGTRAAIRTVIRYRHGYLMGRGASLLDGYMEDLATDRIYRLMIAQRYLHGMHTAADITRFFDEELARLLVDPSNAKESKFFREARRQSEEMIRQGFHDPI